MRVLYIYDLKFKKYKNELYSKNFSQKTWLKYMKTVDEIDAYIEVEELAVQPALQLATTERVTFIELNKRSIIEKLKLFNELSTYDFLIIRMPSKLGVFLGILAILKRKKFTVEVVGNFYEALHFHGSLRNKILALPLHLIMKWLVKKAAVAVYVTKDYLQTVYPNHNKTFFVPNAIIEQRAFIERSNQPIKIGMIGALNITYKGHHLLFKALETLDRLNRPIEISLLGEGQLEKQFHFKNIIVKHLGLLSGSQLNEWYKSLTIYVQPSLTEAGARSIMEAMSFSLPVVASRVGGVPELIDDKALVEKNNSESLANTLERFLKSPHLLQQQARRNYDVIQAYDIVRNQASRDEMLRYLKKYSTEEAYYEKAD